jgi:hypothetical protein
MASLGIVIAVSDYTRDAKNLPACKRDGAAVAGILRRSGKFSEILQIDTDTTSTHVKQRLTEFINVHGKEIIDEVMFYFTGHGEFYDNEFYYLLTDYQEKRIRQTSLEGTELDTIIRSVNPALFVKIVDACHSGMTYIKSNEDFQKYVKATNSVFRKLYFMFSSQSVQFSYQNNKISYFTESILKAVANHPIGTIRYKDIIDYVSDDFKIRDFQTPLFVTQADFTEILCDVTQPLKQFLSDYIQTNAESSPELTPEKAPTIVDRLKEDAKRFCTKEEAHKVLESLRNRIDDQIFKCPDIDDLYKINATLEEKSPPNPETIGQWVEKNKGDYFAEVKIGIHKRTITRNKSSFVRLFKAAGVVDAEEYEESFPFIDGFSFTSPMPFNHIKIRLEPALPNITPEECFIVPILSRTNIRLFWAFSHFEYIDWESARRIGGLEWSTDEAPLKDEASVDELIKAIVAKFRTFVEGPLRAKWASSTVVAPPVPPAPVMPAE